MFLQSLVKTPATAVSSGREHAKSPTLNSKSWDCRFNFMWSKTTQLFVRNTLRIDRFVNRFLHVATTFNHQFEKKLHISRLHHFTIVYLSSPILVSVLFSVLPSGFSLILEFNWPTVPWISEMIRLAKVLMSRTSSGARKSSGQSLQVEPRNNPRTFH